jgi:hypothetical protein
VRNQALNAMTGCGAGGRCGARKPVQRRGGRAAAPRREGGASREDGFVHEAECRCHLPSGNAAPSTKKRCPCFHIGDVYSGPLETWRAFFQLNEVTDLRAQARDLEDQNRRLATEKADLEVRGHSSQCLCPLAW